MFMSGSVQGASEQGAMASVEYVSCCESFQVSGDYHGELGPIYQTLSTEV